MKNFCLILTIVILTITFHASAQERYKTTNFTHDLAPVKVSLTLLGFENVLYPITAGLLVEGVIGDKFFYNAQLRQGYLRNFMIVKDALISSQKESNGTVFEAGVAFPFSDITKPSSVKVTTSTAFDGRLLTEKYFRADCEKRRFWAVSGGLMYYVRPKYINSDSSEYIISGATNIKAPKDKFIHLNQTSLGLYGGIERRKIRKAIVKSAGYNYRVFYATKFYAHLLIASTKVDQVLINNRTYNVDNAKQMPLGYRIGWQWDKMGTVTGFEFGKMPGVTLETPVEKTEIEKIFSHNPFLNYARVIFSFNLYNSDKNYHLKGIN